MSIFGILSGRISVSEADGNFINAGTVLGVLESRGQTLATCESLTAGALAARIADIPGASAVLQGGLVTYSADLKTSLARVDADVISQYGVVSAECARAMAAGARIVCESDWAVSLTGVAGPGAADGHASGDVYIAVAGPKMENGESAFYQWPDVSRAQVRGNAVDAAIQLLYEKITLH